VSRVKRISKIINVVGKYRLDLLLDKSKLSFGLKLLLLPIGLFGKPKGTRGERLRKALEELGPIFVKFGQLLSTRPDLVPMISVKSSPLCKTMFHPFLQHYLRATSRMH